MTGGFRVPVGQKPLCRATDWDGHGFLRTGRTIHQFRIPPELLPGGPGYQNVSSADGKSWSSGTPVLIRVAASYSPKRGSAQPFNPDFALCFRLRGWQGCPAHKNAAGSMSWLLLEAFLRRRLPAWCVVWDKPSVGSCRHHRGESPTHFQYPRVSEQEVAMGKCTQPAAY